MKKVVFLAILLGLAAMGANAQTKELKTESDGFQWYITYSNDWKYEGAESKDGKTLIPFSRGYSFIYYNPKSTIRGYFTVKKDNKEGACDINGREVIAPGRYDKVTFHDKKGIIGYYIVKRNGKEGACDINGSEIIAPTYSSIIYSSKDGFNYRDSHGKFISIGITLDAKGQVSSNQLASDESSSSSSKNSSKNTPTTSTSKPVAQQTTKNSNPSVTQKPKTNSTAPKAVFEKIWLEHNVMQNGEKGMKVHVKFTIHNMKGKSCEAIAFFDSPQGVGVPDRNGNYCSQDGKVISLSKITPRYDIANYNDLAIFIPNNEIHLLPGKHTYYTRVFIKGPNGLVPGNSDFAEFSATGSDNSPAVAQQSYSQQNKAAGTGKYGKREGTFYFINDGGGNGGSIELKCYYKNGNYYVLDKLTSYQWGQNTKYSHRLYYEDNNYYYFRKVATKTQTTYYPGSFTPKTSTIENEISQKTTFIIAKDWSKVTYYSRNSKGNDATFVYNKEISKEQNDKIDEYWKNLTSGTSVNTSFNSSDYQTPSSNSSSKSRRTCPMCNGAGKLADQITYAPCYTGDCDVYCSTCGRVMSRHSHHRPTCQVCYGKGYVE